MEEHPQARTIIETLHKEGFIAYYAGGWVRDFLLGCPSDDIDIATNAPPETIQVLFPKTLPIGIAFGIILVIIDGHEYEVATFRHDSHYIDGRRPAQIEFTTPIEDAKRRDFTINGMFYDPITQEIFDYVGGKEDLKRKLIRAIGNPHERFKEDRLRMIRAIRLACRFNFAIDPPTQQAIRDHATELFPAVAIERVVQEMEKGRASGKLREMLIGLHDFGLLPTIFPELRGHSVEERLNPQFPKEAPLIAYLLQLFPNMSLKEQLALCKSLKLSNTESHFATVLFRAKELSQRNGELCEWAHFYANPLSGVILQILDNNIPEHEKRKTLLQPAIERIIANNPVVKAEDLIQIGIEPGIKMGQMLKEAERLSINNQIYDKKQILERLK